VESNVERVRDIFARFNATGQLDFAKVQPDVELHDRPDIPDARIWRGTDGVQGFFAKIADSFDPIRWEPRELIAAGRHVVVRARLVAYGRTSGAPIETDEAQLWSFRDGLVARLQGFPTIEEAYVTMRALDESEGIKPASLPPQVG
jgi:ketosteroid isomerase-like protein